MTRLSYALARSRDVLVSGTRQWRKSVLNPPGRLFRAVMPKSLMGRSLLIIVTPLIVLQIITATIFFDRHWDTMKTRLNTAVATEIGLVVEMLEHVNDPVQREALLSMVGQKLEIRMRLMPGDWVAPVTDYTADRDFVTRTLETALTGQLPGAYFVDILNDKTLVLYAELPDGLLEATIPRKRLFSSTVYIFMLWMVASSIILFAVAWMFMQNQVRPIRRLAESAEALGKGRDVDDFPARGATEVRKAGIAFIRMRDRLRRQVAQRTEMLAGVSHDLRTPLTRMRLQLALMESGPGITDLETDIAEMERLIEGYLAFARSDDTEETRPVEITDLVQSVVTRMRRTGGSPIDLHLEEPLVLDLKPHAVERCLANIIGNGQRYADHVAVRVGTRGRNLEILVDDDGPGIPPDKREDVFRAFVRLESSRNPRTGGTGLGLTIALDSVRAMGGDIRLESSPMGGLRARILFPV